MSTRTRRSRALSIPFAAFGQALPDPVLHALEDDPCWQANEAAARLLGDPPDVVTDDEAGGEVPADAVGALARWLGPGFPEERCRAALAATGRFQAELDHEEGPLRLRLRRRELDGAGALLVGVLDREAESSPATAADPADLLLDLLGTSLPDLEYPLGALRWLADLAPQQFLRLPEDLQRPFRSVQKAARHFSDLFSRVTLAPPAGEDLEVGDRRLVRLLVVGGRPDEVSRLLGRLREQGLHTLCRPARGREEILRAVRNAEVDAVLLQGDLADREVRAHATVLAEVAPRVPVFDCAGVSLRTLAQELRDVVERNRRIGAADEVWRRIEELALRDALTGVLNRRAFERFASQEFARAQRYDFPLALALFDLDHFKQVNDRYGHPAGDRFLQVFAGFLQSAVRQSDLVARLGGDEFAVLMSHTPGAGALTLTRRLRDAAEGHLREVLPPMDPPPGVSVGLAIHPDEEVGSWQELVARADQALYRAKREGRGRSSGPE